MGSNPDYFLKSFLLYCLHLRTVLKIKKVREMEMKLEDNLCLRRDRYNVLMDRKNWA